MPKPIIDGNEKISDLHFPFGGLDVAHPYSKQPNVQVPFNGNYARTAAIGVNVRSFEPVQNRSRGGSRSGLTKYIAALPGGVTWITQLLDSIVTTEGVPVQLSQSGRIVTAVAVSQGNVFFAAAGAIAWTEAANATPNAPPLNFSGLMFSAPCNQKLWFADGINYCFFDPSTGSVQPWTASAGLLPVDSDNNTPRLICSWRDRIVLSGLINDPQDIFFSQQGDPTNWDYAPLSPSPIDAFALNLGPTGQVGDVVTALIPYSTDVMVCGTDHEIFIINGDPQAGGQVDLVTDAIGMAFGESFTKDPYGTLYFFSNRCGIYSLVPGNNPQRISQPIEFLLQNVDTGNNGIRLIWDDRTQGLHVFITALDAPAPAQHFFWEMRANAWWVDEFADDTMNPLCCCTFDGNFASDRVILIGSWTGYVRAVDSTAVDDDGVPINSQVFVGPLLSPNQDTMLVKDLQAVLGAASGSVSFAVYAAETAELALASAPVVTGTWNAARNFLTPIRRANHALYVAISASNSWSLEQIRVRLSTSGKVRMRSKY